MTFEFFGNEELLSVSPYEKYPVQTLKKSYSQVEIFEKIETTIQKSIAENEDEPLCKDNPNRFCLFPIQYHDIWNAYKKHKNSFWTAEEIDFSADKNDWEKLNENEKYFIEHILAFFAGSDGIVLENLMTNFCKEVMIPEARCFYGFQAMMENIHCCSKDTLTLTDKGWKPLKELENSAVSVWNGEIFTNVRVQFTGMKELYRVELENGFYLDCTEDHHWYILQGEKEVKCTTRQLLKGDEIFPYELPRISDHFEPLSSRHKLKWLDSLVHSKYENPLFPIEESILWTVSKNGHSVSRLMVRSIQKLEGIHPTYCFNEPLRGKGVFNGILTGQSEVYSLMIDTLVADQERKNHLFKAISTIPCIQRKAEWALKWIHETNKSSFAQRLYAFGIVEGLFFSGSFCAIFWLKERGLMANALGKSNEWISRDESLHTEFAILLYKYIKHPISTEEAHSMMNEAVIIEEEFICESLPVNLIGMNSDMMRTYIRFVADRLLSQFGYEKLYFVKNPFQFMEKISLDGKTNFFEQRVSEYSLVQNYTTNDSFSSLVNLDNDDF